MPHIILASQSSSSEVNGHGKILSTSFGGSIAVGDHLSSASEIHLSKDKSEVVIIGMCFESTFEYIDQLMHSYTICRK